MNFNEELLLTRLSNENENEENLNKKLVNLKGRDILKEYPKYREYLKRKFMTENENHEQINELIKNIDFFEYIEMIKNLDIEQDKIEYIINQSLFYVSQVFDEDFNDNEVKMKSDTQRIFDYEIKTEKLKRFFDFLKMMQKDENKMNKIQMGYDSNITTFRLYYQMKKTFIFMKELKNTDEEEYLNYLNSKLGFSIDNFLKIKNFIHSPNSNELNKNDKQDVLGFCSTFGVIPRNFKNSRNYQNQVFQQIDENNKKKKIIERMTRKLEEKKKLKIDNQNQNHNNYHNIDKSVSEIDEQLNNLNLSILSNDINNIEFKNDNENNSDNDNEDDEIKNQIDNKNKNSKKKNSKNKKRKNKRR